MSFLRWTIAFCLLALMSISKVEAQNLVHLWAFENNFNDTSGSGNHGAATGAPSFVAGKFGQAIEIDAGEGVDVNFGANNLPLLGTDTWAMNLWVNLSEAPGSLEYLAGFGLDDQFVGGLDEGAVRAFITVGQNFYFWGGAADVNSGVVYDSDSQWHMYTLNYNGATVEMYKDASFLGAAAPGGPFIDAFDEVHVGNPSNWNSDFNGQLDEFAIFDAPLNESQIGGLFFNNDINQPVQFEPTITVNRDTGEIVFTNDSSFDIEILGYTVRSASGALDPSSWNTINGRFDSPSPGDGSIDSNDTWTVFTDTGLEYNIEFSEGVPGTDGGTVAQGKVVSFGNAWVKIPTEDVVIDLLLNDGEETVLTVIADFIGNGDSPVIVGDFNDDGTVDMTDWATFRTATQADLSGLTLAEAYYSGDLDGDLDKDLADFDRFVEQYEMFNGPGSFAAALSNVPEPSAAFLVLPLLVAGLAIFRQRTRSALAVLVGLTIAGFAAPASADLWGYYPLNGDANDASGNNIDLTLFGDAGFAGTVHPGLGSGLALDGDGDGAVGQNFNKFVSNNVTVSAWVYTNNIDVQWDTIVKNWGSSVGGQFHFGLGAGADNFLSNYIDGSDPVIDDVEFPTEQWVHTAFVLDSTAGQHRLYMNGQEVASGAYSGALGMGTATGLGIGAKPNDDGSEIDSSFEGGAYGPWNGAIDDVALFDEAMTVGQIDQLYQDGLAGIQADGTSNPYIHLEVDRGTGEVKILNQSSGTVNINAYQISSEAAALRPAEWQDLAGNSGFPTGNGTGNGWEQDLASDATQLLETYLAGNSTVALSADLSLGDVFTPGGTEDLLFQYRLSNGSIINSIVEYVGIAPTGLDGDFNDDGTVDAADYVVWRNNLGGSDAALNGNGDDTGGSNGVVDQADYQLWKTNFGATSSGSLVAPESTVPEPSTLGIAALGALGCWASFLRRR